MRKILIGLVACAALAAPLVAATAANASVAAEPMTERQAGKFYQDKACQVNLAHERLGNKVWRGREFIKTSEVQRRLKEVTYETDRYGKAVLKFATKLLNPPAPWPDSVGGLSEKLANANIKLGTLVRNAGTASSGREWSYYWGKARRVDFGQLAARIRATLDLPPSGEGC